jgi:hypothetical protein
MKNALILAVTVYAQLTDAVQSKLKSLANWEISKQLVNGSDEPKAL